MSEQSKNAGFRQEELRSKDTTGLKGGKETNSNNTQSAHDIARDIALNRHKHK